MFTARDIMRSTVVTVTPERTVQEAVDLLITYDISGLPVVTADDQLVGIFSVVDHYNHLEFADREVANFMTEDVATVDVEEELLDVVQAFRKHGVHRIPVLDNGKLVGIIGGRDLLRFIRQLEEQVGTLAPLVNTIPALSLSDCWVKPDSRCNVD